MKKLPLRVFLPVAAGLLFAILCFAGSRENQILDAANWTHIWSGGQAKIGTPADVILLTVYLPALICLIPLLPLIHWVESEMIFRSVWGITAIVQWFLIGRYFDVWRGLLPARREAPGPLLRKLILAIGTTAGAISVGCGFLNVAQGHHSLWAILMDSVFIMWGLICVITTLRWRSSWARHNSIPLRNS